jgi:hypothetical protein
MTESLTVYVSIGNSDDRLSQHDWSCYVEAVDKAVDRAARFEGATVHGRWYSLPHEAWQNACWCVEFTEDLRVIAVNVLKETLPTIARQFGQDSIAWAEARTEFLRP